MFMKFQFDHTNKLHMPNPAGLRQNDTQTFLWDFAVQTDHLISARRPDRIEKRAFVKSWTLRKRKGKNKPIEIGCFGTVTKWLLKGLKDLEFRGRVGTIKILHYWERQEYWQESWRLEEACCHLKFSERLSANADVKNSEWVNNNNNNNNNNN